MTGPEKTGPFATVAASWGDDAPDWVAALADECTRSSQAKAAAVIGRSPAVVSQALHRRYPGDMNLLEELVRARIMGAAVACPALGDLPLSECRDWRDKASAFMSTNALRVRMFRACSHCPLNRKGSEE